MKKTLTIALVALALTACGTGKPKIIQATSGMPDVHITTGMATQIEMPDSGRVQSVIVGDPALLTADQAGDVVNLVAKGSSGETNLIIRSKDDDGDVNVYQYRVYVESR